jgi:tape measure domain-containing protein
MAKNIDVGVKITADSKGLVGESRAAKEAIKSIGDAAKKSNAESSAAADRFVASLKRQADTLGMTASQLRAYDAAQLKLNEAQRASVEASNRAIAAHEKNQAAARANVDVLGRLQTNLVGLAAGYVSVNAAIAGGKAIIDAALAQDRLNNTLKVGTGSAEAAARETQFLREESEKLGLQFATTSQQYAKLSAAAAGTTLQGQATRDIFLGIAKASTVLGLSADQAGGALNAIQQMISKGTVAAEELRGQLGERLPGAFQMAARALGVTTSELDKMLVKGEVTATRLLPALAVELEKTFGAQAQEAAQGLGAKINRLDNAFTDLKIAIGNTGLLDLLSTGIVLATRFVDALSGAKVLSAVDAQKQKIAEMRAELESLGNSKHIPVIGDLLFDRKQADLLSQRIDDGVADLAKLEKAAQDAAEAMSGKKNITPGAKPEMPKEWADELEKQAKAREKAAAAAAKQAQQAVESSNRIIAALKLETEQIGLNAIQKRMMSAATEAAKAPTKELANEIMEAAAAWGYAAQQQENLQAAEKERIEGLRAIEQAEKEAARATEARAKESSAYWNQMWRDVEQTGRTVFTQLLVHGKSAFESIGDTLKIAVADVLFQLTMRKWMINIGASFEGAILGATGTAAGVAAGSGALNSAGNIGTGVGIANLFKGGFSGLRAGISGVMGGAGSVILPLAAAFGLDAASNAFAGDKTLGNGFTDFMQKIPVLGAGWDIVAGLFGRAPLKQRGTSLTGEIGAEGFESGYLQTRFKAKGGLFRSDKIDYARVDAVTGEVWTDNNKLLDYANDLSKTGKELFGLINDTTKQTSSSLRQIGQDLDVSTAGIDNFKRSINLLSEKGKMLTEEQIGEEIQKITDGLAHSLLPQVDELAKRGETALQTVSRLGTEFTSLVDAATIVLGKSAADARAMILGSTFEGRTGFVDAAGGADALTQMSQYFAANFLTDTERLAPNLEGLNTELNRLNLSTDLTRDQFRGLVQSFGQVGGVSEEVMLSLLKLAPAFIDVRNAQDALTQSNRAALLSTAASAYSDLQKSVDAERIRITNDYNDALKISNERIGAVTDSVGRLKSLSEALKSTVDQIRPIGRDAAKQQIQSAIDAARAGNFADSDSLRSALGALGNSNSIGYAAGSFEFAREQAKTANLVGELGSLADSQLLLEERSLAALEESRKRLDRGFADEMTRLDGLLAQGQKQIDVLNGINTSVLSLQNAIGLLNLRSVQAGGAATVINPATGTAPISGNPGISDQQIRDYVSAPGRSENEIYRAARENGVSFAQFAAATDKNVTDLYAWADARNLPRRLASRRPAHCR